MMNFVDVFGNVDVTTDWLAMDDFVDYVYTEKKTSIGERIRAIFHI